MRTLQRIDYKVALVTFKVRSTSTPSYLRRIIQDREHGRNLRSTTTTLCQPFTTTTFAKLRRYDALLRLFGTLSKTVVNSDSVAVFKSRLKTFLFSLGLSLFPLLSSTLPGPNASEVTTLWRYTNAFIIIIVFIFLPQAV